MIGLPQTYRKVGQVYVQKQGEKHKRFYTLSIAIFSFDFNLLLRNVKIGIDKIKKNCYDRVALV